MTQLVNNSAKGLMLAMTTAIMWGILPLALKSVLLLMDAYTITWYRFIFAAFFVGLLLAVKRKLPSSILQRTGIMKRLLFAAIFLSLNYIMYLVSLHFIPAETAQMLIQMAPFMMLLGSVIFIKESFSRGQMVGSAVLISGLLLFFNQQFFDSNSNISNDDFLLGFLLMLGAAITWAAYAILQKKMLRHYSSNQVMWCIYLLSAVFFLPLANPEQITSLNTTALLLLLFCCANTLVAYGTFAKSLEYLPTAKVSATLAITPLLTVAFANIAEYLWPTAFQAQHLNLIAYIGAGVVVLGSMLTALGDRILSKNNINKLIRLVLYK
ncbi:EamA domain-containing membrane protein RarD [Colwellia chukchiensis]|uniref:EamA domain-containing membrane protein RarD n=1 Tax=Colwellia chukchiensis TaxID=641665 RepID=A0A1H7HQJ7_9GAMM|nr:DMT family transporter [Colwellia chukchiensis]SEK52549.1 EamA domain-containing membrane protein RarD [Colwellia chukchiensis]